MNRATSDKADHPHHPPMPHVKKSRRFILLIWIVPVLAAVMAGFYFYDRFENHGPKITIKFNDATGLKAGESKVMHLGVEVGEVTDIQLGPDKKQVLVGVLLKRSQDSFADKGATFWVARPEISTQEISGLSTVLSGPFIDSIPGSGDLQSEFTGLDKPPLTKEDGIRIVLKYPLVEHLQPNSPVYFRGIQVGIVESIQLSPDAISADVHAFIRRRFVPLVKTKSKFWIVSAVDLKGGLFTGVQMKVESLHSLISGGVAFATPTQDWGDQAENGTQFDLHDEPDKDWLKWEAKIAIGPGATDDGAGGTTLPQTPDVIRSAVGK